MRMHAYTQQWLCGREALQSNLCTFLWLEKEREEEGGRLQPSIMAWWTQQGASATVISGHHYRGLKGLTKEREREIGIKRDRGDIKVHLARENLWLNQKYSLRLCVTHAHIHSYPSWGHSYLILHAWHCWKNNNHYKINVLQSRTT